ncbi:hypothetical protein LZ30DRAFT_173144 [Colletotrichum cereale]|nr:hypothetical protein LZ30DRAFT_173144 [Colletotrichum cereale]
MMPAHHYHHVHPMQLKCPFRNHRRRCRPSSTCPADTTYFLGIRGSAVLGSNSVGRYCTAHPPPCAFALPALPCLGSPTLCGRPAAAYNNNNNNNNNSNSSIFALFGSLRLAVCVPTAATLIPFALALSRVTLPTYLPTYLLYLHLAYNRPSFAHGTETPTASQDGNRTTRSRIDKRQLPPVLRQGTRGSRAQTTCMGAFPTFAIRPLLSSIVYQIDRGASERASGWCRFESSRVQFQSPTISIVGKQNLRPAGRPSKDLGEKQRLSSPWPVS